VPEGKGEGGSQRGGEASEASDQTPGSNSSPSQLEGAVLHYWDTAEQLAAEGRPTGQKRDQRVLGYWADKTMCPLEWEVKT